VLSSFYKLRRTEIFDFLYKLLSYDEVDDADKPALHAALLFYSDRNFDFVDAYLAAKAIGDGSGEIYTFDRDFDRLPGVKRRDPGGPR